MFLSIYCLKSLTSNTIHHLHDLFEVLFFTVYFQFNARWFTI